MKERHLDLWEAVQNHSFQIISTYLIIILVGITMCVIVIPIVHHMLGCKIKDGIFMSLSLLSLTSIIITIIIGKQIYDDTQKTYISGQDTVKATVTADVEKVIKGEHQNSEWSFKSNGHVYHVKPDPNQKDHNTPKVNDGDKVKIDMNGTFLHKDRTIYDTELDYRIVK